HDLDDPPAGVLADVGAFVQDARHRTDAHASSRSYLCDVHPMGRSQPTHPQASLAGRAVAPYGTASITGPPRRSGSQATGSIQLGLMVLRVDLGIFGVLGFRAGRPP